MRILALEGMQQLLNTIKLVRDRRDPKVFLFGVVLTMYDPCTRLAAEVVSTRHLVYQILPHGPPHSCERGRDLWRVCALVEGRSCRPVERRGRMRGGGGRERRPMTTPLSL